MSLRSPGHARSETVEWARGMAMTAPPESGPAGRRQIRRHGTLSRCRGSQRQPLAEHPGAFLPDRGRLRRRHELHGQCVDPGLPLAEQGGQLGDCRGVTRARHRGVRVTGHPGVTLTITRRSVRGHRGCHGGVTLAVTVATLSIGVEQDTPGRATIGRDLAGDQLAGPGTAPYRVDGHAEHVCRLGERQPATRCHPSVRVRYQGGVRVTAHPDTVASGWWPGLPSRATVASHRGGRPGVRWMWLIPGHRRRRAPVSEAPTPWQCRAPARADVS
jgi:hypothetical protein